MQNPYSSQFEKKGNHHHIFTLTPCSSSTTTRKLVVPNNQSILIVSSFCPSTSNKMKTHLNYGSSDYCGTLQSTSSNSDVNGPFVSPSQADSSFRDKNPVNRDGETGYNLPRTRDTKSRNTYNRKELHTAVRCRCRNKTTVRSSCSN